MGYLNWIKSSASPRSKSDDRGAGWQPVSVYFYRADGRYPPASRAETAGQFVAMIPKIGRHIDDKLEVRITDGNDHLLFHATQKGIEWDGIALSPILDHERSKPKDLDAIKAELKKSPSWDR
jgi:hypothetical protein